MVENVILSVSSKMMKNAVWSYFEYFCSAKAGGAM